MPRLLHSALSLRRDPRILKLPPYLLLLCIVVGVVWLLLLPLDRFSRNTYISENALLPGQVHTYFGGSDQNIYRAYRREVQSLANSSNAEVNDKLEGIFKSVGLKVGRQRFAYRSSGETHAGENLYAILQAPRGDATEAIVLVAAWKDVEDEQNEGGVALALTLARYFKRWSLWSKDIIVLVSPDSLAGPQAWVDAYHDAHDAALVSALPLKSGALQGAIAIDFPAADRRFSSVHVVYDGVNGQLPNLDLVNSVINVAEGQMGMGVTLQQMWHHDDGYGDRLRTVLRGMLVQGLGVASGPHSSFIPYHVDAVTLQPYGDGGWQDEMGLGRVVEGSFRSLNNLLEHLHQSFFFYLLMAKKRFVSIGTYLPSAMLIAASFTIMAIALWVKSGQPAPAAKQTSSRKAEGDEAENKDDAPPALTTVVERDVFLPLGVVAVCQFLGAVPLYLFNHLPAKLLTPAFVLFAILNALLPHALSHLLTTGYRPSAQQYQLVQAFSLLLLGMFLSALATLNYSLAFLVGLLAAPVAFLRPWPARRLAVSAALNLAAPPAALAAGVLAVWALAAPGTALSVGEVLRRAAFGWDVWGMYTAVVVWCVWWPAWLAGSVTVLGRPDEGKAAAGAKAKTA